MSELKDRQELVRGDQASAVLNNPIYQEAFVMIRARLMEEFQKTKFKENDERNEIWRKMQTVEWVDKHFKQVMQSGNVAKATLVERGKKFIPGI
ncbi:MAG: hypothetical protein JKY52_09360 [Flavobacteriales bacterium]|nr:hypothetical protein [Flavobacteriales bacterium]